MISHTFRGKRWKVRRRNSKDSYGKCDDPTQTGKTITLDRDLSDTQLLTFALHESLHACLWDLDETVVERSSQDIARFLRRLGFQLGGQKVGKKAVLSKQAAAEAVAKYGSVHGASKHLGISRHAINKVLGTPWARSGRLRDPEPSFKAGRPVEEFAKTYSAEHRIKEVLEKLGDGWDYESAIAKATGINPLAMHGYRAKFEQYIVDLKRERRKAWAGKPEVAKLMRGMV